MRVKLPAHNLGWDISMLLEDFCMPEACCGSGASSGAVIEHMRRLPDGVQFDCNTLPHNNAREFCIRFKCPRPECAKDSESELNLYPGSKQPLYGHRHNCRNLRVECWQEQKTLMRAFKPGVSPSTRADPKQAPKIASM